MPRKPPSPCTWPQGCPALVPGGGRCPTHTHRTNRPSAAARGYGRAWGRTRQRQLEQVPYCEQPSCFRPATVVDHIDGLGPSGPLGHNPLNLRSLCKPHHDQRTARDQPGGWNDHSRPND